MQMNCYEFRFLISANYRRHFPNSRARNEMARTFANANEGNYDFWRMGTNSEVQAPVVQRLDNAIHRINHYPADSVVCFVNTYPLDSDLSGG